jgi:hypothetical protein
VDRRCVGTEVLRALAFGIEPRPTDSVFAKVSTQGRNSELTRSLEPLHLPAMPTGSEIPFT